MEKKILLAVDGSANGFETVSIVGRLLKDLPDPNLLLFHCVQQLAVLSADEIWKGMEEVATSYQVPSSDQEKMANAILREARRRLLAEGFPESGIHVKFKADSTDPAQDILREAEAENIGTVALGRRGRSQLESLLLGSVSSKVAQYATQRSVWIVDKPVEETRQVLVAMEEAPEVRALVHTMAEIMGDIPGLRFMFLHLIPPIPPSFWDDGHILSEAEQRDRQSRIEKWRSDWVERMTKVMAEARGLLLERGVPEGNVQTLILPTKQGIARDLLNEIAEHKFELVVMGKKSFHQKKPFHLGSHANKILQNIEGATLCLVDAQ